MSIRHCLKTLVAASIALTSIANAAVEDDIAIGGSVESSLVLTATPDAGAQELDLTYHLTDAKIVKVAALAMMTNDFDGLTLTVTSGNMTNGSTGSISFQVDLTASAGSAPSAFVTASGSALEFDSTVQGSFTKDLWIKYTPSETQEKGAYTGNINVSVSDNT